jgi:molybdopterin-biosynthesis enzyme MoeA-like protein
MRYRAKRRPLRAVIVTTGTELTLGSEDSRHGPRDENGPVIAKILTDLGIRVIHVAVTPDDDELLVAELRHARAIGADIIVTTGGRGSTPDDRTTAAIAEVTGKKLVLYPHLWRLVMDRERAQGEVEDEDDLRAAVGKQVTLPEGIVTIPPLGTAAPFFFVADDGVLWLSLPGPPWEAKNSCLLILAHRRVRAILASAAPLKHHTVRVFGGDEKRMNSALREAGARGLLAGLPEPGTCFAEGGAETRIDLLLTPDEDAAFAPFLEFLVATFGDGLFSVGPTLDELTLPLLEGKSVAIYGTGAAASALHLRLEDRVNVKARLFPNLEKLEAFAGVREPRRVGRVRLPGHHEHVVPEPPSEALARHIAEQGLQRDHIDFAVAIVGESPAYACVASKGGARRAGTLVSPQEEQTALIRRLLRSLLRRKLDPDSLVDRRSIRDFRSYELLRLLFAAAKQEAQG